MGRWEPNARGRLELAAMELFRERGFEQTTVAEIAARAGLTERTFFRHYADKREVLFYGSGALQDFLVEHVDESPPAVAPIDAIVAALAAAAVGLFADRREFVRQRRAVIAANAELQERELVKLARLAAGFADALRRRGVPGPAADLASEAGVAIFKVAFERWVAGSGAPASLEDHLHAVAAELREITAERPAATAARPG
jgi:AcrR family transcriptional regulator